MNRFALITIVGFVSWPIGTIAQQQCDTIDKTLGDNHWDNGSCPTGGGPGNSFDDGWKLTGDELKHLDKKKDDVTCFEHKPRKKKTRCSTNEENCIPNRTALRFRANSLAAADQNCASPDCDLGDSSHSWDRFPAVVASFDTESFDVYIDGNLMDPQYAYFDCGNHDGDTDFIIDILAKPWAYIGNQGGGGGVPGLAELPPFDSGGQVLRFELVQVMVGINQASPLPPEPPDCTYNPITQGGDVVAIAFSEDGFREVDDVFEQANASCSSCGGGGGRDLDGGYLSASAETPDGWVRFYGREIHTQPDIYGPSHAVFQLPGNDPAMLKRDAVDLPEWYVGDYPKEDEDGFCLIDPDGIRYDFARSSIDWPDDGQGNPLVDFDGVILPLTAIVDTQTDPPPTTCAPSGSDVPLVTFVVPTGQDDPELESITVDKQYESGNPSRELRYTYSGTDLTTLTLDTESGTADDVVMTVAYNSNGDLTSFNRGGCATSGTTYTMAYDDGDITELASSDGAATTVLYKAVFQDRRPLQVGYGDNPTTWTNTWAYAMTNDDPPKETVLRTAGQSGGAFEFSRTTKSTTHGFIEKFERWPSTADTSGTPYVTTRTPEYAGGALSSIKTAHPNGTVVRRDFVDSGGDLVVGSEHMCDDGAAQYCEQVAAYTYLTTGQQHVPLTVVDRRGGTTTYGYIGMDVKTITEPKVTTYSGTVAQPLEQHTTYGYDSAGRVTSAEIKIDENGTTRLDKTFYDEYGRVTAEAVDVTSAFDITSYNCLTSSERVRQFVWDGNDRLTKAIDEECHETVHKYCSSGGTLESTTEFDGSEANGEILSSTSYDYDGHGRLTSESRSVDEAPITGTPSTFVVTEYEYDSLGRRTLEKVDATGLALTTTHEYDYQDRLVKTTLPTGVWTRTIFDGTGRTLVQTEGYGPEGTAQPDWRTTTYEYDASSGELTTVVNPDGLKTVFGYDSLGRRTSMRDRVLPSGAQWLRETIYGYDALGQVTRTYVKDGSSGTVVQDTVEDFDELGRVWRRRGRLVGGTDSANDPVTLTKYNTAGWVVDTTRKAPGNTTDDAYQIGDARDTMVHNKFGEATSTADPTGVLVTSTYDRRGHRKTLTVDPGGVASLTEFAVDGAGRAGKVTHPHDADGDRHTTVSIYDASGRRIRHYETDNDAMFVSQERTIYDGAGNRTRVIRMADATSPSAESTATDQVSEFVHSSSTGQMLTSRIYNNGDSTPHNTTFEYDSLGRRTKTTDAVGAITEVIYDVVTGLVDENRVNDGGGLRTQAMGYDSFNRLTSSSWIASVSQDTLFEYDALERQTAMVDPDGIRTEYLYDGIGRQAKVTEDAGAAGLSRITEYLFDRLGRLEEQRAHHPAGHQRTVYLYDLAGRRTSIIFPDPAPEAITFTYDNVGRLSTRTDQNGWSLGYTYDPRGMLITRQTTAGTPTTVDSFEYDAQGRMTLAVRTVDTVEQSRIAMNYNHLGFQTLFDSGVTRTVTKTFDQVGNRTTCTYPGGAAFEYKTYDGANQPGVIRRGTTDLVEYSYTGRLLDTRTTYTNYAACPVELTYDLDYGEFRRIRTIDNNVSSGSTFNHLLSHNEYTYSLAGDRTITFPSTTTSYHSSGLQKQIAYEYDSLHRLTKSDYVTDTQDDEFTYDVLGNRVTWEPRTGSALSYQSNVVNEYTDIGGTTVTHDDNGNLTADADGFTYEYDVENRLTKVLNGSTTSAEFWYDSLGRRVASNIGGKVHHYYYDGQNVIEEYSVSGTEAIARYILNGMTYIDERLVLHDTVGGDEYYYVPRELHSVEALVNNCGHEVERYTYDAYGKPVITIISTADVNFDGVVDAADVAALQAAVTQGLCVAGPIFDVDGDGVLSSKNDGNWISKRFGPGLATAPKSGIGNPYLFTGRRLDAIENGHLHLYHYRARSYDPTNGRFLQRDSLGYVDGLNLYEYAKNNPLGWTDPSGNVALTLVLGTFFTGKAIGSAIEACYSCWKGAKCWSRAESMARQAAKRWDAVLVGTTGERFAEGMRRYKTAQVKAAWGAECLPLWKTCGKKSIETAFWMAGQYIIMKWKVIGRILE